MGEHIEVGLTDGMSTIELGELGTWFEIPDLSPLWDLADERGTDVELPQTDGDRPYPRWRKAIDVALGFNLRGDLDIDNDPVDGLDTQRTQLWDHRQYLAENVCGRSDATDGSRPLTLYLPDDSTAVATCHIGRRLFFTASSPIELAGILHLTVVEGELTVEGS